MSPPAPRRLAVLRSHLQPDDGSPPPSCKGEKDPAPAVERVAAGVSTSPCASTGGGGGGRGDGDGRGGEAAGAVGKRESCVFCRIIRDGAPAFKLYEDDVCLCILDSHPLANGHSLIIPKHHYPSLETTPPSVVAAMCSKVPFLSNAIMKATQCDSFNLVVNNGAAAGQVIFHTHFHIIPRRSGDKLWPTESFRRCSIEPNETSGLVSCIKEQLDSSPGRSEVAASSLRKES